MNNIRDNFMFRIQTSGMIMEVITQTTQWNVQMMQISPTTIYTQLNKWPILSTAKD